jgi:hypothetical protein
MLPQVDFDEDKARKLADAKGCIGMTEFVQESDIDSRFSKTSYEDVISIHCPKRPAFTVGFSHAA